MTAIGIQLYTLRRPFSEDPMGTLQRIRDIGYDAVEFAAPLTMDFDAMGARMKDIGLDCPSAHVGIGDMGERPDAVLAMAGALACRYIVMPYVEPQARDWPAMLRLGASVYALAKLGSALGVPLPEIMKAGSAWGEWGIDEVRQMIGYAPAGMERAAGRWKAPLPEYALSGDGSLPVRSVAYVLSAFLGIIACGGGAYLLARWLTRRSGGRRDGGT